MAPINGTGMRLPRLQKLCQLVSRVEPKTEKPRLSGLTGKSQKKPQPNKRAGALILTVYLLNAPAIREIHPLMISSFS